MVYYCLATQLLGRRQLLVKHNISGKSMGISFSLLYWGSTSVAGGTELGRRGLED